MIFSSSVAFGRCTDCGHDVESASSTSALYFLGLVAFGVAIIMPQLRTALEPAWWQWPIVILMESAALMVSAMIWSAASSRFRESMQKCSDCGGRIEVTGSSFHHSFVPSANEVGVGLLYAGTQLCVVMAIAWLGNAS